jgi:hypothetical protein
VRIRRRKPCFLCRRRLFGWYVRLLTSHSWSGGPGNSPRTGSSAHHSDPPEGWPTGTAHPRPYRRRGHAAPVDTGPTDQRYAGGALRVNLSTRVAAATGRAARCWAARRRPNRVRTGHGRTLGRRAVGDTPEPVQGMRQPVENWLIHRLSGC